MIHGRLFKTFSTPLFKETSQKRVCEFFVPFKHILKALFVGISKVQEQAFSDDRKGGGAWMVTITIYFIHPSGKLKLSFDLIHQLTMKK